jgi:hypothetical protein
MLNELNSFPNIFSTEKKFCAFKVFFLPKVTFPSGIKLPYCSARKLFGKKVDQTSGNGSPITVQS